MKFQLKDRVIWKDGIEPSLKGYIFSLYNGITIQWDNGRIIHYDNSVLNEMSYYGNNDRKNGYIDIDLSYIRELKLNQLGI